MKNKTLEIISFFFGSDPKRRLVRMVLTAIIMSVLVISLSGVNLSYSKADGWSFSLKPSVKIEKKL